jgi:serine/threonine protein kinase
MTEETLFDQARALPEAERVAFLEHACPDADLRARVLALLAADVASGNLLDATAGPTLSVAPGNADPTTTAPSCGLAGVVVAGKYTLMEPIGEGGMGSVWRARQTVPVKRFVALKLIKAGMDGKQVLMRFEAERQALALMDHPNIAKVLDGGVHAGRPYFVMELVKGTPITQFCDANRFTPRQRLELFVQACQAIQHAHQKGIIHRDIKPSNVLVALYDDRPVVKVIDFGVAKATGGALTEGTLDTGFGGVVGTPQYMSPEQATFNNLDIDTRSDVYALGVLLYELLTGTPPFSRKELEKQGLLEILRVVREEEPPRPSQKLSTAETLPSIAAVRGTQPSALTGLLRSELDWVVMKALEKDRTRRYETANGFAADVQRYLAGEPVQAHPPSTWYRLGKFVRRNRVQVTAAGLVLAALLVGVVGTTLGLLEARRQADIARTQEEEARKQAEIAREEARAKEQARAEEAKQRAAAQTNEKLAGERLSLVEAEKQRADREREIARAVKYFLENRLLAQADPRAQANELLRARRPGSEPNPNLTVRELLDRAAKELAPDRLEASIPKQPLVQADILLTVGNTYRGIGETDKAIDHLARALGLFRRHRGPNHQDILYTTNALAQCYLDADKIDQALLMFEEAYRLDQVIYGPDHPNTLATMHNLARCCSQDGKWDKAVSLLEECYKRTRAKLGPNHPSTLTCMGSLAFAYHAQRKVAQALSLYKDAYIRATLHLGSDHPGTLHAISNLAMGYRETGELEKAIPLLEECYERLKVQFGPDHPETVSGMTNLAGVYHAAKKRDRALPLFEAALKQRKARLGPHHSDTLTTMRELAECYREDGKGDKAVALYDEILKISKANRGPDHLYTLVAMNELGFCYWLQRKLDRSIPLFEALLPLQEKKFGRKDPQTQQTVMNLGVNYLEAGRVKDAIPLLEEGLTDRKARLGLDHPDTLKAMDTLAEGYWIAARRDRGLAMREEIFKVRKGKLGPDHPDTLASMNDLGRGYQDAGQMERAATLYEELFRRLKAKFGSDHPNTLTTMNNLGFCYWSLKRLDRSVPIYEELLPLRVEKLGRDHPDTLVTIANLGVNYKDAGRLKEAIPLLEEAYRAITKHPQLVFVVNALFEAYTQAGKRAEAVKLTDWIFGNARKRMPKDSPELAKSLADIGGEFLKLSWDDEAERLLREALAIREKRDPGDWDTHVTRSMLGGALLGQKKYAGAEPLLLKGYEGMRKQFFPLLATAQATGQIARALDWLIELYRATGKPDLVKKYRALRDAYPPRTLPLPKEMP